MKQSEEIDLRELAGVITRRKWSLAAFAIAIATLVSLLASALTPIYKATATILIESQQANVVSIQEVYGVDAGDQQYYATQFEILSGRPIAENVIESLGLLDVSEFRPRPSRFRFELWPLAASANESQRDPLHQATNVYAENLMIEPVPRTQLVNIHFQSPDQELAASIANAHAEAYIESILDARVAARKSASDWMGKRIEGLRHQLTQSESELQRFRETEGLVDVEGLKSLPNRQINELSSRLIDANRRLTTAKVAYLQIYRGGDGQGTSHEGIPAILKDEVVQQFQQSQAIAQQKVAELRMRYGPLHPKLITAQTELEKVSESLQQQQISVSESIKNEHEVARTEVAEIERALAIAKADYQDVGRRESKLVALQREVDANRQLYDMFYNRMKETAETDDLDAVNARILAPAIVPYEPHKPRKALIVSVSTFGSVGFAVLLLLVIENLNNRVRKQADVEDSLGAPFLGTLPLLKGRKHASQEPLGQVYFDEEEHVFNEAIRTIRTGISLSGLDKKKSVVLITSSLPGEGKSTLALNLAFAFGQNEKVLLIDADLRRASISRHLELPRNSPGFSGVAGGLAKLSDSIVQLENGGIEVLPSGLSPTDPLALLALPRINTIFRELKEKYDRIIIDSPPIIPVSDTAALSVQCDAVVFAVRYNSTTVTQARRGIGRLRQVEAPILGVVLTQVDSRSAEYGDYNYGYGYSYSEDRANGTS